MNKLILNNNNVYEDQPTHIKTLQEKVNNVLYKHKDIAKKDEFTKNLMKYDKNTIKEKMTKNNYQSKNQKKIKGEYELILLDELIFFKLILIIKYIKY